MSSYKVSLGLRRRTSFRDGLVMGVVEEMEGNADHSNILEEADGTCGDDDDNTNGVSACERSGSTNSVFSNSGGMDVTKSVAFGDDVGENIVWGSGVTSTSASGITSSQSDTNKSSNYKACGVCSTTKNTEPPRKTFAKITSQVVAHAKLKKFRKYDTFIWVREPAKGPDALPAKPLNRLRSLSSL